VVLYNQLPLNVHISGVERCCIVYFTPIFVWKIKISEDRIFLANDRILSANYFIFSVKIVYSRPGSYTLNDRILYLPWSYTLLAMIVYFTCHDHKLHYSILIKDQMFGFDGFHQHTYFTNIHTSPTKILFANIIHQHTYTFEWADLFSPTYYFTNIIFTNIILFRRWMLVKVFHQHTCFSPTCIFHQHPSPTLEQPFFSICLTKDCIYNFRETY